MSIEKNGPTNRLISMPFGRGRREGEWVLRFPLWRCKCIENHDDDDNDDDAIDWFSDKQMVHPLQ